MTTYSAACALDNYNVTDESLRALLTAFYAALETGPMTLASDTGQIDETTITAASVTTSQTAHYKIHYLNDSLHGTAPIYVKTNWFVFNAGGYLRYAVTVGTGSDGAGNITGIQVTMNSILSQYSVDKPTVPVIGSGGEGYASVFVDPGGDDQSAAYSLGIFRTTDSTDDPTDEGVFVYFYKVGDELPIGLVSALDFKEWQVIAESQDYSFLYGDLYRGVNYAVEKDYAPVVFPLAREYRVVPHLVTCYHAERTYGTTFAATPLDTEHTYMPILSNKNSGRSSYQTDTGNQVIAIIQES